MARKFGVVPSFVCTGEDRRLFVGVFTGSVSSVCFSNIDIREFVGGIELVSGRSRLSLEELTLLIPPLFLPILGFSGLGVGCEVGVCPPVWCGLGEAEPDLLAAKVAAMKEADRLSGLGRAPGERYCGLWGEEPKYCDSFLLTAPCSKSLPSP